MPLINLEPLKFFIMIQTVINQLIVISRSCEQLVDYSDQNYLLIFSNSCSVQKCNVRCQKCLISEDICVKCQKDQFIFKINECLTEEQCQEYEGYYANYFNQQCQECIIPKCLKCYSEVFCRECLQGFLLQEIDFQESICVKECNEGYFQDIQYKTCFPCYVKNCAVCDKWRPLKCQKCKDQYILISQGENQEDTCKRFCPQTQYYDSLNMLCKNCFQQDCLECQSYQSCNKCVENKYLLEGILCEDKCPTVGYFQDEITFKCQRCFDFNCEKCIENKYACLQCNKGFYLLNQICHFQCPNGYYESDRECLSCDFQCNKCINESSQCLECSQGYLLNIFLQECTQECREGFFESQNYYCFPCDQDCKTCLQSEDFCTSCKDTDVLLDYQCYDFCPHGYYQKNQNNLNFCLECEVNDCKICDSNYPKQCEVCLEQFVYDQQQHLCLKCDDQNCLHCSSKGEYKCTSCYYGYFLQDNICVEKCSDEFYQDNNQCLKKDDGNNSQVTILILISVLIFILLVTFICLVIYFNKYRKTQNKQLVENDKNLKIQLLSDYNNDTDSIVNHHISMQNLQSTRKKSNSSQNIGLSINTEYNQQKLNNSQQLNSNNIVSSDGFKKQSQNNIKIKQNSNDINENVQQFVIDQILNNTIQSEGTQEDTSLPQINIQVSGHFSYEQNKQLKNNTINGYNINKTINIDQDNLSKYKPPEKISEQEFKNKYKYLRSLGEGTYGVVDKYISIKSKREVAVKKFKFMNNKGIMEQGLREANVLQLANQYCKHVIKLEKCYLVVTNQESVNNEQNLEYQQQKQKYTEEFQKSTIKIEENSCQLGQSSELNQQEFNNQQVQKQQYSLFNKIKQDLRLKQSGNQDQLGTSNNLETQYDDVNEDIVESNIVQNLQYQNQNQSIDNLNQDIQNNSIEKDLKECNSKSQVQNQGKKSTSNTINSQQSQQQQQTNNFTINLQNNSIPQITNSILGSSNDNQQNNLKCKSQKTNFTSNNTINDNALNFEQQQYQLNINVNNDTIKNDSNVQNIQQVGQLQKTINEFQNSQNYKNNQVTYEKYLKNINNPLSNSSNANSAPLVQDNLKQLVLVLEIADSNLEQALKYYQLNNLKFSLNEISTLFTQMIETLYIFHNTLNIAHRDIKPQNILQLNRGYKLCDLGVAKCIQNSYFITQNHTLAGTLNYISPEEKQNYISILSNSGSQQPYNPYQADIFSLGITLYEVITLQSIIGLNDNEITLKNSIEKNLMTQTHVPYLILEIVNQMLQWYPEKRITAKQLAKDLNL